MPVSERRVCRVLGQHRSTQRKTPRGADDEAALTEDIIALARQYGRYGYRRVTALLRDAGWHVNRKRVERIWRREGLKVPQMSMSTEVSADVGSQNSLCWRFGTAGDQPYSGSGFPFVGGRPRRFGGGALKATPLRTFSGTRAACSRMR